MHRCWHATSYSPLKRWMEGCGSGCILTCSHIVTLLPTLWTCYFRQRGLDKFTPSTIPLYFRPSCSPLCYDRRFGLPIIWNGIDDHGVDVGRVQVVKWIIHIVSRYMELLESFQWITFPPLAKECYEMLAWVLQVLPKATAAPLFVRDNNVGPALSAKICHLWPYVTNIGIGISIGRIGAAYLTLYDLCLRIMFSDFIFSWPLLEIKYIQTCSLVPMNLNYLCNLCNKSSWWVCSVFPPIRSNPCGYDVNYLLGRIKPRGHVACV